VQDALGALEVQDALGALEVQDALGDVLRASGGDVGER